MIFIDNETDINLGFDYGEIMELVCRKVLEEEGFPVDSEIFLLLTDNNGIWEINKSQRDIDSPTDVLSFPNLSVEQPGVYRESDYMQAQVIDPETGLLILGDIVISLEKVQEQATAFGHSLLREFAFLVAHSMLHLCGYDHMEEAEAAIMEKKQETYLAALGIVRD